MFSHMFQDLVSPSDPLRRWKSCRIQFHLFSGVECSDEVEASAGMPLLCRDSLNTSPKSTFRFQPRSNATYVAKCKQLISLCPSLPFEKFGNQCNSKIKNTNRLLLFQCFKKKKRYSHCPKRNRKGEGRKRASAFVLSSVHPYKTGILPCNVHMPPVSSWESCYTSDAVSVELRTRVVRIL